MPKQINTYLVGSSLVRRFGLKGRYQPVLDEVIVPVVNVDERDTTQVRMAVGGALGAASGAGNQRLTRFLNPPNSKVLVTITDFWGVSGAPLTDYFVIEVNRTDVITATGAQFWRDSRLPGSPVLKSATLAAAAAVLGSPRYHMDNDDNVYSVKYILAPGDFIQFRQNAQNQTFDVGMAWEETDLSVTDAP